MVDAPPPLSGLIQEVVLSCWRLNVRTALVRPPVRRELQRATPTRRVMTLSLWLCSCRCVGLGRALGLDTTRTIRWCAPCLDRSSTHRCRRRRRTIETPPLN